MGRYTLMHKKIPVAELVLDMASGAIAEVGTVYETAHIPVGIAVKGGRPDRAQLNAWWQGRAIPASRSGLRDALSELQLPDAQLLLEKCMGLSLSDQYWIRPQDTKVSWEEVNFFENPFSEDVGNVLFGKVPDSACISLMSPDNTSDGWLKKKWKIIDGKRCLIKGGSGATRQEPYNEVLASRIMKRLGIPHVPYELIYEEGYPYSVCEDFITADTELIPAWRVIQTGKKENHISWYQHYRNCCERLEIPGMEVALNWMMVLDYLVVNEDRHLNNFGVVRNADTLEFMGAAPVYDSGTSLWFDKPTGMIDAHAKVTCKPFKNSYEEQIKLVTDFEWLNFRALDGIEEELREIVSGSLFVDAARCDALCRGLSGRVKMLEKAAEASGIQIFTDSTQFDVEKNVAYSGEE